MTLPTRKLGRTGAEVTVLGYGAMELRSEPRGGPAITEEQSGRVLGAVLDGGINLIDTSLDYGRSEEMIGRFISHRRDEYFLATKCGCPAGEGVPMMPTQPPHDFGRVNIRAGLEQSLRTLQTDRVDLLQVHMAPSRSELEENDTVATMLELRDEGKIRFLGMSGRYPTIDEHIAMGVFDVFQIPYSVLQREHEEVINDVVSAGAGVIIRGGAARGAPSEEKEWNITPLGQDAGVAALASGELASLDELLDGMGRIEFVLRFTLSHPGLSTTIVGTGNLDHLASNITFAERGPLPEDLSAETRRRLDALPQ